MIVTVDQRPSNTMSSRGNDSAFQRALARFKGHLSPAKQKDFSITSLRDVQETIAQIQNAQGSEKKMRNLTRVRAFVEAMEEFGKIIEVFLNVSEIIAFVWVCRQSQCVRQLPADLLKTGTLEISTPGNNISHRYMQD